MCVCVKKKSLSADLLNRVTYINNCHLEVPFQLAYTNLCNFYSAAAWQVNCDNLYSSFMDENTWNIFNCDLSHAVIKCSPVAN